MVVIVIGVVRYFGLFGAEPLPVLHEAVPKQKDLVGFAMSGCFCAPLRAAARR